MIYTFLQKILTRPEKRKVDAFTDSDPSEAHKFNYRMAKPYIQGTNVLDIGCWTGQFEKLAVKDTKKLVGVDPNEDAIRFARSNNKKATFINGSATKLPVRTGTFDAVTFFDVLEHVPVHTEIACMKEIHRVLKPKGVLLMCTPYRHALSILADPAFWGFGHRHYGRDELEDMLQKSRFRVRKVLTAGGIWSMIAFPINMIAKHILKIKFNFSELIKNKLVEEYNHKGVMGIFIIAEKY